MILDGGLEVYFNTIKLNLFDNTVSQLGGMLVKVTMYMQST